MEKFNVKKIQTIKGVRTVEVTEELRTERKGIEKRISSSCHPLTIGHCFFGCHVTRSIWHLRPRRIIRDTARARMRRDKADRDRDTGKEKGAAGRRFCWCQKEDPPLRIALKETDVGLAGPPFARVWPAVHKSSA